MDEHELGTTTEAGLIVLEQALYDWLRKHKDELRGPMMVDHYSTAALLHRRLSKISR